MDDFGFKPVGPAKSTADDYGFKPVEPAAPAAPAADLGFTPKTQLTDVSGGIPIGGHEPPPNGTPGSSSIMGKDALELNRALHQNDIPNEDTSLAEDFRRAHEFVSSLPSKLGQAGWSLAEGATDLPLRKMAAQHELTGSTGLKDILDTQGIKAPVNPSPLLAHLDQNNQPIPGGTVIPGDVNLGGSMEGVTARQWLNKSVDATLGRTERFLQRTVGQTMAQMMLSTAKTGADLLNDTPQIQGLKAAGILAPDSAPADDYGARQWLTVLAGEKFNHEAGSPEEAAYNQRLKETYGDGSAQLYKMGVSLGKQWPVFLLPGSEGKWASTGEDAVVAGAKGLGPVGLSKALPAVSKAAKLAPIKQNLGAAALQSAYMSAAEKEDFLQSTEEGTAMGGLLGLLHVPFSERSTAKSLSKGIGAKGLGEDLYRRAPNGDLTTRSTGVLVPAKSFDALKLELDRAIDRSRPEWRTPGLGKTVFPLQGANGMRQVTGGGEAATNARKALEGQMFADQLGPGQYDFDLKEGGVTHPTFSAEAIDSKGQLVMRDYEIVGGPGDVTKTKPRTVTVETKGQPEAWTKEKKLEPTAHSTNVTVRYRDTPITDTQAMARLNLQKGRYVHPAAQSDEVSAITGQLAKNIKVPESTDFLWGTPTYMSPEEAIRQAPEIAFRAADSGEMPRSSLEGPKTGADRPKAIDRKAETVDSRPAAVVLTARKGGGIKATPINPGLRPINTRDFRPGDFVREGHPQTGWAATVEGTTPEGNVLIRNPAGKLQEYPKGDIFLSQDTAMERGKLGQDSALRQGAGTGVPTGPNQRLEAIILANKNVTPLEVLKWDKRPPTDLAWATNLLDDMAIDGKLKETSPGHWESSRQRQPISKDITPETAGGQTVYYAKGGEKGLWGVLRGPDQRTKGNWLVEVPDTGSGTVQHPMSSEPVYKKTHYISVPEEDVRTKWPVLMADKSKVNPGIDAYGWTKPMPPQFIAKEPLAEVDKMSKAWSRVSQPSLAGAVNAKGDAMWHAIVGAMHQADPGIRTSAAQKGFAARGVMRAEALAVNQFLEQRLGRGSMANQEMGQILEQHRARSPSGVSQGINPTELAMWATKYPKEAAASMADIQAMVQTLDQQSKQLADYGVGNIEELETKRAGDSVPEYLTTSYAAFQMPRKEWATYARKNLTQEWADALAYLRKQRPDLSGSGVADELEQVLRLENPLKGFEDRGYIKAEAKAKLGAKVDVPAPIRAILGEHKDASMRLAFSLAYQRQLIKQVEGFNAIAMDPDLFSPGKRPDMTLRVPDNALFGKAANGYVNDNAATRFLIEGPKASHADAKGWLKAIGYMGQKWKTGHTVYNQASWVANVARNAKGVMLSPWDADAYKEAASMLADYHRDPTAYGPNKLLIEAMDFDAVGPGLAGAELGAEQRKFQRRVFDTFSQGKSGFMDTLSNLRDHAMSVPESVHKGYDSVDKVAKFGSYIAWRRSFIAAGMSIDDAAALSALRVNELFPNYSSHSSPQWAVDALGGKAGGLWAGLGPWATSKLQDTRVNGNIVKNLVGAVAPPGMRPAYYDPSMWWRMMRLSAMVGGAATIALNTRRMNGISDAQDMLERSQIPIKAQKYSHLLIGSLDYDEHGRRTFYPLDTFEDLAMTMSGNMGDHPVARSVMNNFLDVVGPDTIQGQATQALAAQLGVITPDQPQSTPRADQTGYLNTALKYAPGVLPQAPFKATAAYSAMNPSGRMVPGEGLTGDQAITQGLGVKQIVVGPQTHKQTLMETAHNVGQKEKDIRGAAVDAALNHVSSERQKYMLESNVRALKKSVNIPRPLKPGNTGGSK